MLLSSLAGVAAEALGRIGSTGATQSLLTALADAQMTTRRHAALGAIEAMGEPAVVPLEEMLASTEASARGSAAEALGWIASPSATTALLQALGDSEPVVRAQAAWALGELAAPQARAALERVQGRDRSLAVRQAAGQALAQFELQPIVTRTSLMSSWALALNRWETLLWLIPALLSMLAAAWLLVGFRRRSLAPVAQRGLDLAPMLGDQPGFMIDQEAGSVVAAPQTSNSARPTGCLGAFWVSQRVVSRLTGGRTGCYTLFWSVSLTTPCREV